MMTLVDLSHGLHQKGRCTGRQIVKRCEFVAVTHGMLIRSYISQLLDWSVEGACSSKLENGSVMIIDATAE